MKRTRAIPDYDGGEEEDHRHQDAAPPGVGLHGAEDEAHVAVEEEGGRNPDDGDPLSRLRVEPEGLLGEVRGPQGEDRVEPPPQSRGCPGPVHQVLTVVEPDLEEEDHHEVPRVDEPEHGHGRGRVRRHEDLVGPLRVTQVGQ